jgi:hypothetical protein
MKKCSDITTWTITSIRRLLMACEGKSSIQITYDSKGLWSQKRQESKHLNERPHPQTYKPAVIQIKYQTKQRRKGVKQPPVHQIKWLQRCQDSLLQSVFPQKTATWRCSMVCPQNSRSRTICRTETLLPDTQPRWRVRAWTSTLTTW